MSNEDDIATKESTIDKDWEVAVKQINAKIKEAAKCLLDAQKLAKKNGVDFLTISPYDDDDLSEEAQVKLEDIDVGPLEGAMDAAGWQTSSWYC